MVALEAKVTTTQVTIGIRAPEVESSTIPCELWCSACEPSLGASGLVKHSARAHEFLRSI